MIPLNSPQQSERFSAIVNQWLAERIESGNGFSDDESEVVFHHIVMDYVHITHYAPELRPAPGVQMSEDQTKRLILLIMARTYNFRSLTGKMLPAVLSYIAETDRLYNPHNTLRIQPQAPTYVPIAEQPSPFNNV